MKNPAAGIVLQTNSQDAVRQTFDACAGLGGLQKQSGNPIVANPLALLPVLGQLVRVFDPGLLCSMRLALPFRRAMFRRTKQMRDTRESRAPFAIAL